MITSKQYDALVIGAGAAGMAAACEISREGFSVALLDREPYPGGVLLQCIHNGFGLHHFKKELTGPEYADEYIRRLSSLPAHLYLDTTAVAIHSIKGLKIVHAYSACHGVMELSAKAIVLAMGCRERNRGNIGIPGTRPAGIFTAGLAQRLLNIDGCVPGKKVVIVGSGDIGLIMARRLSWIGAKVLCIVEILTYPSGLTRNIVQCLQDFNIPLYLSHAVTKIIGQDRVSAVEISPLQNGTPDTGKRFRVSCDTVLLSVGLIPENELSRAAGIVLNPSTNGPVVDHRLQTSMDGVFACGNVLHVHDLVDFVSEEAQLCGRMAAAYLRGEKDGAFSVPAAAGANVKYVIPNRCAAGRDMRFFMRSLAVFDSAELTVRQGSTIMRREKLRHVRPAEMLSIVLTKEETRGMQEAETMEFSLSHTAAE